MPLPSGAPPLWPTGAAPLVGRGQQLTRLLASLEQAQKPTDAARPVVVLLTGAPGIGKTRLLEAFPPSEAAGVTTLRGGASQAAGLPPYLPFLHCRARPEDGEELFRPMRTGLGEPIVDTFGMLPAAAMDTISKDSVNPVGIIQHTAMLAELSPEGIDTLVGVAGAGSGLPLLAVELRSSAGP